MARRKVFIIGDAERMVVAGRLGPGGERVPQAARGAARRHDGHSHVERAGRSAADRSLPVIAVRALPLTDAEMKAFVEDKRVANRSSTCRRTRRAGQVRRRERRGASPSATPGPPRSVRRRRFLDARIGARPRRRARVALSQGASGARGKFSDTLDALTSLLHDRAQAAAARGEDKRARGAAHAIAIVERTKELATGNVNPQLLTAALIRDRATRPMTDKLSHVDDSGAARMVDVSGKPETHRRARATGAIRMRPRPFRRS